jgi:uncharacterized RDD family membrane protein YckC
MRKASWIQRLIAIIIDGFVLGIIAGIVIGVFGNAGGIVGFLVGVSYQWYFLTRNKGQTPGKVLIGIRVVKKGGGRVNDVEAVVRYVGYYVNTFLFMIGWIWPLFDRDNQGFHDKLAGTIVVKA